MARKLRIAAIVALAIAGVGIVGLGGIYAALGRVRPFYEQALKLERQTLEAGRREMESRATVLYSEIRREGQWQAAFTANEINGWLALQLSDVYGDALPEDISEPRVAIGDGRFTIGFRARRGGVDTIVSADASVTLTETGEVAIRLHSVRAGALPLPVMHVADDVARACQALALPVRWTQDAGQPVALIDVSQDSTVNSKRIRLDAVELHHDGLYLAGHTVDSSPNAAGGINP
jgi:hypothetical protein